MAKPDLDNGYLMVAHELMAAVMVAHIPQESRIVLFEVFSQVYGPAKLRAATLRPGEIASRTGQKPNNVSRAITWLVDHGILRREGLNAFYFVKDYDAWKGAGKPILPGPLAYYPANAPRLAMSHSFASLPQIATKKPIKSDIKTESTDVTVPQANVDLISQAIGKDIGFDTSPPYREKREVAVVVEGGKGPTPSDRIVSGERSNPAPRGADGKPLLWSMYPTDPDPAEVERIAELCANLAGPEEDTIPGNVRRSARMYPLWYFPFSIRLGVVKGHRGGLWSFAVGIMRNLWTQGYLHEPQEAPTEFRPRQASPSSPARSVPASRASRSMAALDDPPTPSTKERA